MVKTSVRVLRSAAVTGTEGNDSTERRSKVSTVTVTGDQTEENRGSHHGFTAMILAVMMNSSNRQRT